jgi:hypothetical protein
VRRAIFRFFPRAAAAPLERSALHNVTTTIPLPRFTLPKRVADEDGETAP